MTEAKYCGKVKMDDIDNTVHKQLVQKYRFKINYLLDSFKKDFLKEIWISEVATTLVAKL